MYILNFEVIEKLAQSKDDRIVNRLDTWLMQWYNSSDGLKQYLLQSLSELYNEEIK